MSDTQPLDRKVGALSQDAAATGEFEALLAYLRRTRGVAFNAYKRSTLMRRVLVRMQLVGIQGFANYQDHLEVDPLEFAQLFNTILINVTAFFRDPPAWEYLAVNIIPDIVRDAGPDGAIRVWSAGCASGEEAYTIAMLLAEALGKDGFRDRVKIYATDIDEEALTQARQASYDARNVEGVPPELLKAYFDQQGGRYVLNRDLRRAVIFGRHDLIQDAPISRVSLVICRNCLMYFNSEAQHRIVSRLHFALVERGVLFLGKAETLLTLSTRFVPLDAKRRLFARVESSPRGEVALSGGSRMTVPSSAVRHLQEVAAEALPLAHAVVDTDGTVVQLSQQLQAMFGLSTRDIGRPIQDLELSYRPFELRTALEQAYAGHGTVSQRDGRWIGPGGQTYILDLLVVPLPHSGGGYLGASVCFTDVTRQHQLQETVQRSNQELETALEELQSTNEELETTNEELQSTVEELETTNEELQSTNEELETMNEELQSTNEELQAMNEDARERARQLSTVNAFLESILGSLRGAVVMLDTDLSVQKWNRQAEELWGLKSEEVLRKNFLNLDSGLPVAELRESIRTCLSQKSSFQEVALTAVNRRGKPIHVNVTCTPLAGPADEEPRGVILLMDEVDSGASQAAGTVGRKR